MVLYSVDQSEGRDAVPKASVLRPPATVSSHSPAWLVPSDDKLEMIASLRHCAGASCKTKLVR